MKYKLMNYKYEVAILDLDLEQEPDDMVLSVQIIDRERIPLSIRFADEKIINVYMAKWLQRRLMPVVRENAHTASLNEEIGTNRLKTALKSYAASITDCYWLKGMTSKKTWEEINFFTNNFYTYDVGNYIFDIKKKKPSTRTPDITTNGTLPKTWRKINGKWCLFKGGKAPDFTEPCNEEFVSRLMEKYAEVPYVTYRAVSSEGMLLSVCENFITEGYEFVPAIDIYQTSPKSPLTTVTKHMLERCDFFDIPGAREFIINMKAIDFIIGNMDRHLGNWGFIFDVEKACFIGPAPLFDNGTSMMVGMPEILEESKEEIEEEAREAFDDIKNKMYMVNRDNVLEKADLENLLNTSYMIANFDFKRIDGLMKRIAGRCTVLDRYIEQAEIHHEMKIERENELEAKMEIPLEP